MPRLILTQKDFQRYKGFEADMKKMEKLAREAEATATWQLEDETLIVEVTSTESLDYLAVDLKEKLAQDGSEMEVILDECDAQVEA